MSAAGQSHRTGAMQRGLSAAGIVLGSLFLLLLALGTSAFLIFSALEKAQVNILSERFQLLGREGRTQIESGLRFGRPLEQFLGLETIFEEIRNEAPEVTTVFVTDATGAPVGPETGPLSPALIAALTRAASASGPQARPVTAVDIDGSRHFVTPLRNRDMQLAGLLVFGIPIAALSEQRDLAINDGIAAMLIITGLATALLAVAAGRLRMAMARQNVSRWRWMLFPLVVLLGAQIAYSVFVLQVFRANYATATISAAESVGARVEHDLSRLLALGLTFERMPGLDTQLETLLQLSGAVSRIEIVDTEGVVQIAAVKEDRAEGLAGVMPVTDVPPHLQPLARADRSAAGAVRIHVSQSAIARGLADQIINVITVTATSAFFMIELLVLMQVLFRRGAAKAAATARGVVAAKTASLSDMARTEPMHLIARPVMFGFVFSWALPLSFLPLKMRSLGGELFGLPPDVVLAMPISVEMGCALITAVLAGRLADQMGWHLPFLAGLVLSAVAGILAAFAPDELTFVLARGVTGLGYGLAWMGIQAFVVQYCPQERRGQALANLLAGILAGFITGTAVGGLVAEQFGHDLVLLGTAAMVVAPLAIGLVSLRRFMARDPAIAAAGNAPGQVSGLRRWAGLLSSPEYVGVLLFSVVPFSIAQVGLLYFAVPLHLDRIGASASDAGRIMMVYGVVVILLGPVMSGLIDSSRSKAMIVVTGGLVGGAGLAILFADLGMVGIFLATTLLSLSSVLIEPARAAFILNLEVVRDVGLASALGLQRAADKMGQMIGPLLIAVAFSTSEIVQRVAFVGIGFVIASLMLAALILLRAQLARVRDKAGT